MTASVGITPKIYQINVTQKSNNVIISAPGPQGPAGTFSVGDIPVIYPITNISGSIGYSASYVVASATFSSSANYATNAGSSIYSSSASISASTTQTNFSNLTISGSQVATQAYVQSSIPASATYAGSALYSNYAASAGNSNTTSQTNFNILTLSGSNVATQAYVLANIPASATYAGSSQYATNSGSATYASSANYATEAGISSSTRQTSFSSLSVNGDLNVSGNTYVSGSTFIVSASNISTNDPLIYIGMENPADINDLGIVGSFTSSSYQHTGIVRDHSDGVWKLFSGVTTEPTNVINFASAVYDTLKIGGLQITSSAQVVNLNADLFGGITSSSYALRSYVNTQDSNYYASAQAYANSASLNAYNTAVASATSYANSASLSAYNAASAYAISAANAASSTAYNAASAFAISANQNYYASAQNYTSGSAWNNTSASVGYALNSASLGGIISSSYALQSYVNTASLNAYNTASAYTKSGSWSNANASVAYSSSVGGNLVGGLFNTSSGQATLFSTPSSINIGITSSSSSSQTISIGNSRVTNNRSINIGGTDVFTATETINIGTGSINIGGRTINIGTGTASNSIVIGTTLTASINANTLITGSLTVSGNIYSSSSINALSASISGKINAASVVATQVTGGGMDLVYSSAFSTSSAILFDSIFNSSYNNYKVLVNLTGTATGSLTVRLRASGTTENTAYTGVAWAGLTSAGTSVTGTGTTLWSLNPSAAFSSTPTTLRMEFFNPFLSANTHFSNQMWLSNPGVQGAMYFEGANTNSASYDGFTLATSSSATITGTIRVYGYHN